MNSAQKKGFTLVELSIVLVILGLLVGGVLTGQSLIRAAELRSVSSEHQRYQTAVGAFRDKYFSLPGDMANATQFWGRLATTSDCVTNSSAAVNATKGACDGNGDATISIAGYTSASAGLSGESFQFWRQLSLAGLIEGTFSGVDGPAGVLDITISNSPKSKAGLGLWAIRGDFGTLSGHSAYFNATYGNFYGVYGLALKPEEMWNIDTKIDDGKPGTGIFIASNWTGGAAGCVNAANSGDVNASYNLSLSTPVCNSPFFVRQ